MSKQEQLGAKIAALRKENGMTQKELGEELSISYQAVSKWERGESYPDFDTISKMAKIFDVDISYFESGHATKAPVKKTEVVEEVKKEEKPVGVCKTCGRMVMKNQLHSFSPFIKCKSCYEKEEKEKMWREAAERDAISSLLKKSFIWAFVVSGLILIIGLITAFSGNQKDMVTVLIGTVTLTVLSFFFVTQMFWDGAVFDVACCGGKIVGTPGIIFTFDLDGFIFLIVMKLLFALLRFVIWLATILFFGVIAAIIAPFTFIPALQRVKTEGTIDTDYIASQVQVI